MQHKTLTKSVSKTPWWRTRLMRHVGIGSILTILWLAPLVAVNAWIGSKLHTKPGQKAALLASAGGMQWATSTQTTAPSFSVTVPATQDAYVDPVFKAHVQASRSLTIFEMATERRSQLAASLSSCFRPSLVSE